MHPTFIDKCLKKLSARTALEMSGHIDMLILQKMKEFLLSLKYETNSLFD